MAESQAPAASPPVVRSNKPVSEALLNDKVRIDSISSYRIFHYFLARCYYCHLKIPLAAKVGTGGHG